MNALKKIKWQTVLVIVLMLLLGLNVIFGRSSLKDAKKRTKELELRIDTLRAVENEYKELGEKYLKLYAELHTSRTQISDFKDRLVEISKTQNAGIYQIKNELNDLILKYDTMDIMTSSDTVDINNLRF